MRTKKEMIKEKLKVQYFMKKEELDAIRNQLTLEKWRVLSKAYKIGKKIWGINFNKKRLSEDMNVPISTLKRCLSLDKANKKTWELIRSGKISSFQVAQVCSTKNFIFQDEIIEMIIKDNLSTYQIKKLKVREIEDLNKERHRIAIENGYARKDTAYFNFNNWISRGKLFLLINDDCFPDTKKDKIAKDLKELNKRIKKFVIKLKEK